MNLKVGDKVRFKEEAFEIDGPFAKLNGQEAVLIRKENLGSVFVFKIENFEGDFKFRAEALDKIAFIEGYQPKHAKEMVNHPEHYNQGIEAIDYIESHGMNFNIGNVIKYVTRAKHKGTEFEDLKKAQWYLQREIERLVKDEY